MALALLSGGTLVTGLGLVGCGSSRPPARPVAVNPDLPPVPTALRGLVGTEVTFQNVAPTLVSGYGIVVGLAGTGGLPLNDAIAATVERQLGLMGVGPGNDQLRGTALEGKTPREMLRDPNVAVVEVYAAVPAGLPEGNRFDVLVDAVNATSLEGGVLWTTDLRLGPPSVFGGVQARKLGEASGAIFLNPFAEADPLRAGVTTTSGRVLGGGEMVESAGVVMTLINASHARARAIVSAINSRFPSGAGDPGPTAVGRSDSVIALTIPVRYRLEADEFLRLIENLQIDQSSPEAYARRYVEAIKSEPELSDRLSWALEGLGVRAIPLVRELYDHPELAPRLAGLRAGARLNDPRAALPLRDLALTSQGTVRTQALALLADVDAGPMIEAFLREQLRSEDLLVRVAAYDALALRAERTRYMELSRIQERSPDLRRQRIDPARLEEIARLTLPPGMAQAVSREPVEGKFLLDRVRGGQQMVYVTQQGIPRIAIFGDSDDVVLSGVVSLWDGRLMIAQSEAPGMLRVRHQRGSRRPVTLECRASLTELTLLLARGVRSMDPQPGMGLTYSEVVGALAAIQDAGGTGAAFATQTDVLRSAVLAARENRDMLERPESPEDREAIIVRRGESTVIRPEQDEPTTPTITPITPEPPSR